VLLIYKEVKKRGRFTVLAHSVQRDSMRKAQHNVQKNNRSNQ